MKELVFLVEEAPEGGYTAQALGESIFTEADDTPTLEANIREAVKCHFGDENKPAMIRLHFVNESVLSL